MEGTAGRDWTREWRGAEALALTARTLRADRLADPRSARILALVLELTLLERRLTALAWLVLPGALHVVAAVPGPGDPAPLSSWPEAIGRAKGLHARCDNRRLGRTGPAWRPGLRVRPLGPGQTRPALARLREAPVLAGLCRHPADWPFAGPR